MECICDRKIEIIEDGNGRCYIGTRDKNNKFQCKLSLNFNSKEECEEYLKELDSSNKILCDVCNKNSLCKEN